MNARFVVLGVLLVAIGGYLLAYPGVLSPSSPVYDRTVLVRVAPGNYSSFQTSLAPQQNLQVTLSSSPTGVDFFLMNSSSFSTWSAGESPPVDVYPQSKLDAMNYTFTVPGVVQQNYALVLISRSTGTSTSVLLHVVVESEPNLVSTYGFPAIVLALGVASVAFGATRGRGRNTEAPPEA